MLFFHMLHLFLCIYVYQVKPSKVLSPTAKILLSCQVEDPLLMASKTDWQSIWEKEVSFCKMWVLSTFPVLEF